MKKLFLIFSFCISLLFASNNTTISQDNSQISHIKKENVNNVKKETMSPYKNFVEKPEFTTFCTYENLQHNFIRGLVNIYVIWLKSLSVQNILFAIIAFILYIVAILLSMRFPIFTLLIFLGLPASDLYFNNPLAIIGIPIDILFTGIKLFLAIFGIYLENISTLFIIIGSLFGVFILIGLIASIYEGKKSKKILASLKNIFYVIAMADGKFSKQEEQYLKRIMYEFAKIINLDKKLAESFDKNKINNASIDQVNKYIKDLNPIFEKSEQSKEIKQELFNSLIEFSLIDGLNEEKKDILEKIADELDIDINDIEDYIAKNFYQQEQETNDSSDTEKNDYYKILGVDKNVTCDELKKKYKELAKKYHPDKITSKGLDEEFIKFAEDMFKKVNNAYEVLKKIKGCN